MRSALLPALALASLASAHFELVYPESIGFTDSEENAGPCGGFTPNLDEDDLVDFHVGGDALAMRLGHSRANWLFRVTTDPEGAGDWEQVWPIVRQSGLGNYCQPSVTVPEKYIGKKGVVGVVASAEDGLLYQCVSVNFVEGTADAPDDCKNGTVTITPTEDDELSAQVGDAATETSAAPESTDEPDAGASLQPWTVSVFGMGSAVVVLTMAAAGGLLVV